MRRSPPGLSSLLGYDLRRKRPLVDLTPEEPAPREGPSIVEGSLITSTIPTTGAWP